MRLRWKIVAGLVAVLLVLSYAWYAKRGTNLLQNSLICIPYSRQAMETDLAEAKQRWNKLGNPVDYAITVSWARSNIGGLALGIGDVRVTYHANHAISAILVEDGGEMLANHDPADKVYFAGYDGLAVTSRFDLVEHLIPGAVQAPCYSTFKVSYDTATGYVTHLETDSHGLLNPYSNCGSSEARYWSFKDSPVSPDYQLFDAHDLLSSGDADVATATPPAPPASRVPNAFITQPISYPANYPAPESLTATPASYP